MKSLLKIFSILSLTSFVSILFFYSCRNETLVDDLGAVDSGSGDIDADADLDTDVEVDTDSDTDSAVDTDTECEPLQNWYEDADDDGFGNPDSVIEACEQPEGYVEDNTDCADQDETAFPGSHAVEVPFDGVDQDCDGLDLCRDFNCDGWPDIAFAQTDDNDDYTIQSPVFFGSANGFSNSDRIDLPTTGAMGVDAADLNNDGYIDLVFASSKNGLQQEVDSLVYYNSEHGFDESNRAALPTVSCYDTTIADVDQDGWRDIIFANRYLGDGLTPDDYFIDSYLYWGSVDGYSASNRTKLATVGASRSRVADLNSDGVSEIVFAHGVIQTTATYSFIYWGGGEQHGPNDRSSVQTQFAEGMAIDDVNDDGFLDIVFTSWMCTGCQGNHIYFGDSSGEYSASNRLTINGANGSTDARVADLDGDGQKDIVFANGGIAPTGLADVSYVYFQSNGDFPWDNRIELPTSACAATDIGDLNGDGYIDIVFASHYPPETGGPEVSQIYWGVAGGAYGPDNLTELETTHAAGVKIAGSLCK